MEPSQGPVYFVWEMIRAIWETIRAIIDYPVFIIGNVLEWILISIGLLLVVSGPGILGALNWRLLTKINKNYLPKKFRYLGWILGGIWSILAGLAVTIIDMLFFVYFVIWLITGAPGVWINDYRWVVFAIFCFFIFGTFPLGYIWIGDPEMI